MSRRALLPVTPAAARLAGCRLAGLVLAGFVLGGFVLAGCGQAPPEVTFTVGDRSVQTGPVRHCDIEVTECAQDDSAVAVLPVPAGQPVRISVPDSVAQTPWQVVFRYRKGAEQAGGRSEVFAPGARTEFTLQVPESGTLESLEVQQYGAPEPVGNEPSFVIRAAWVLAAEGR